MKRLAAIWTGKIILLLTKFLQTGGGTAAPGLLALKIDSNLVEYFAQQCTKGSVVITGTNGKTTTSRLISHYFSQNNIAYIHNRAGSNLERGIASAGINDCNWAGQVRAEYGIWEIDEAAFTKVVKKINPQHIILLNLFRDQLDRYGEVDATKNKWFAALNELSTKTMIIYNSDDAQLVHLVHLLSQSNSNLVFTAFSIKSQCEKESENDILSPVELILCPQCKKRLSLKQTIVGLGEFKCANCKLQNPVPEVSIKRWDVRANASSGMISLGQAEIPFEISLPGLFNIYNFTAAATYLYEAKLNIDQFIHLSSTYKAAFARMESITYNNCEYILTLIKNPTGFTESLKTIFNSDSHYTEAIFILNDNYADGRDVSWIWDVNLNKYLPDTLISVTVSGTRVYDMALRLKYAETTTKNITICEKLETIFDVPATSKIIPIFATYTASLELQNYFEKNGVKSKYWKE